MVKGYLSYLVRVWLVHRGQEAVWRASVQQIPTGNRAAFAELEELLIYLREEARHNGDDLPPEDDAEEGR